jgi:predicted O-linked N-acetylglucosamine transferase (SPINDLY family)
VVAPDSAPAQAALASVLARTGDLTGAIEGYRRATRLAPGFADAWAALALLLKPLGRYDDAERSCQAGLQANPRHPVLHHAYSSVLFEQGRVDEAIAEARAALELAPDQEVHGDLVRMLNYTDAQDPPALYREHRAWAERYAAPLERAAPPLHNDPDPARRLRVGYVSPHLRRHAVAFFLEAVLEHHDPARVEVILYADVPQPDDYSRRLQSYGAIWRETSGLTDEQLADAIRRDRVDILVDLTGQTPRHRLLAFARRAAPVQITWSGYPNTTGLSVMDYRITDDWCDPPATTEHLHSERLARLAPIYQSWRPPSEAPPIAPLPALRSGGITFGSFNSCYKVTPGTVALWSRVLARVPGSRLLLLDVTGETAANRYRALFAEHGIDAARLDIRPRMAFEAFLAVHGEADIALDTFPYHGTTTTCFSLWMGLPVVTLAGAVHLSRVGVSLMSNLGRPEWVAREPAEYVEIAARLAADTDRLAGLRFGLRERMLRSPLTDGAGTARALENAFREMWTSWCRARAGR